MPETVVASGKAAIASAARRFKGSFIVKHNRGGKGLGVRHFDDYDALGLFTDEGEAGEVRGSDIGEFTDIPALAGQLAEDPVVHACVATQWFRYATRREETPADQCAIDQITASFVESGQDIRELIVAVATSEAARYTKAAE